MQIIINICFYDKEKVKVKQYSAANAELDKTRNILCWRMVDK